MLIDLLFCSTDKPSYDETICVVRKSFKEPGDGEHVIENDQHFAPRYPVYKFKKS